MSNQTTHQHISSFWPYLIGFVISIILTLLAYYLVAFNPSLSSDFLVSTVMFLAFIQLVVQLYFFLHLGREPKYNWNLFFFISTAGVIFIVIVASIWIMNHLNTNMMANPTEMMKYINKQNAF